MAERLHPGVYVVETSNPNRPIEGVSTSTAAMVGTSPHGVPGQAKLVTSYEGFRRTFGGHLAGEDGYLGHAVEAFFQAGGTRAYVVRILPGDAKVGQQAVPTPTRGDVNIPAVQFRAIGSGDWSKHLRVFIRPGVANPNTEFGIEVHWSENGVSRLLERFDDLSMDPGHERYFREVIEDDSDFVRVDDAFAAHVDAQASPDLAARPPTLTTADVPASGFEIFAGAELNFTIVDSESDAPLVRTWSPSTLPFVNDVATLDVAALQAALQTALGAPFVVNQSATAVSITVDTASTAAVLTLDIGGQNIDLSGAMLRIFVNGIEHAIDVASAAADAQVDAATLTKTQLKNILDAAIGSTATVATASGNKVTATFDARDEGWQIDLVSTNAGGLNVDIVQGRRAIPNDSLTLKVAEAPSKHFGKTLSSLGFAPSASGFLINSPLNPDARPVPSSLPIHIDGGTDGAAAIGPTDYRTGLRALDRVPVNLVALPGQNGPDYLSIGMAYCDGREDCMFIADGPGSVERDLAVTPEAARAFVEGLPTRSHNAAIFYPWIQIPDPVGAGRNPKRFVPPSGHVAGIIARTDIARGVWKAPAGLESTIRGATGLQYTLLDAEQDLLNPASVNCIRAFPGQGIVVWGSRTLSTDPSWRYLPVRRTALFLKESLRRGLQWAVFEPNDDELWDRIEVSIGSFMLSLYRQGAFQGATPGEAFQVTCDRTTNPQDLVDQGIVTARVAFAPQKPAEFVVIEVSQKTQSGAQ